MLYVANDLSYVYVLNDNKTEYRQVFVDVKFEINSGTEVVIVGDVFVGDEIVEIR
jgi:ABC-type phosphate/phosphonate transport system ATPase subunit